jgi:hypothetical protein
MAGVEFRGLTDRRTLSWLPKSCSPWKPPSEAKDILFGSVLFALFFLWLYRLLSAADNALIRRTNAARDHHSLSL